MCGGLREIKFNAMQCNVVLLFELRVEDNEHPNFEWRGGGGMTMVEVTLFEYNCLNNFVLDCRFKKPVTDCTETELHGVI